MCSRGAFDRRYPPRGKDYRSKERFCGDHRPRNRAYSVAGGLMSLSSSSCAPRRSRTGRRRMGGAELPRGGDREKAVG